MKKVTVEVLAMALLMMFAVVIPALAKDFNLPEGTGRIYYSMGEGVVETPANWPPGGNHPTVLRIDAMDVEIGSLGSGDTMSIGIPFQTPGGAMVWLPIAYFTTNTNSVDFLKGIMSGMPGAMLPNNIRSVPSRVLNVERHGNRITVELTEGQIVLWGKLGGGYIPVTIPAFKMELNKVDGSFHDDDVVSLTGYPGASGYTQYEEEMGFKAVGVFTCQGWNTDLSSCYIMMHGITTYVPP